ncbi:MAG: endonuclease domain-containing protein, partial [Chloroflexota bacterium]
PSPHAERGWPQAGGEVRHRTRWRTAPELWARLKPLARQMRREPTPAEELLWRRLRGRKLQGLKFRRQHPLERFILDFYCPDVRLAVEVDGPVHQYSREEDNLRAEFLASQGIRILRFSNEVVLDSTDKVIQTIADAATAQVSGLTP